MAKAPHRVQVNLAEEPEFWGKEKGGSMVISRGLRNRLRVASRLAPGTETIKTFFDLLRPVITSEQLVRIGGDGDGGYLVPDALDGIASVISPGVGPSSSFELEFARRGIECLLFDGTVECPPDSHENIRFFKEMLGNDSSKGERKLDEIVDSLCAPKGDLLLQMDIEGAEWSVLPSTGTATWQRFRIAIVEFHDVGSVLSSMTRTKEAIELFQRIRGTHDVVHFHANNCGGARTFGGLRIPNVFEVTFLRSDCHSHRGEIATLPHVLDSESCSRAKPGALPSWWN